MKEKDPAVKLFNVAFYPRYRTARAARYEDGVLPRLRSSETITLFTPWGPRYSWEERGVAIKENHAEIATLRFLSKLFADLRLHMWTKKFRWAFLGADLYGTRINNLPKGAVAAYFESFRTWLGRIIPPAEFYLSSEFDATTEPYRQRVRENFEKYVEDDRLLARATRTAKKMGRGGDPRVYLIERISEAMYWEKSCQPIKVSCVARHKDDGVDWTLPRLYFLPPYLHAPWL